MIHWAVVVVRAGAHRLGSAAAIAAVVRSSPVVSAITYAVYALEVHPPNSLMLGRGVPLLNRKQLPPLLKLWVPYPTWLVPLLIMACLIVAQNSGAVSALFARMACGRPCGPVTSAGPPGGASGVSLNALNTAWVGHNGCCGTLGYGMVRRWLLY